MSPATIDPMFYRSAAEAAAARAEEVAYVVAFDRAAQKHDAMTVVDVNPASSGLSIDENFFPHGEAFRGLRVHQIRLQGGDASSDSYCYR